MNIKTAIIDLRSTYPAYSIVGGEDADGFWIRSVRLGSDWVWERYRVLTVDSVVRFANEALNGRS